MDLYNILEKKNYNKR